MGILLKINKLLNEVAFWIIMYAVGLNEVSIQNANYIVGKYIDRLQKHALELQLQSYNKMWNKLGIYIQIHHQICQ